MNKKNAQLKASARENLLGHYGTVIAALFLSALIILLLNIPFDNMLRQGFAFSVMSRAIMGILGIVIVSLIAVLFESGILRIHLLLARGQDTRLKDILYPFQNRPDRYFGYGVVVMIVAIICQLPGSVCLIPVLSGTAELSSPGTIGWTVLAISLYVIGAIVLIILMLSWSMTVFILLEDPDIRVTDAIRSSSRMMKGSRGRLFLLYLSFIAWILFGILSFLIGLLWIIPYMTQSHTCFYLDLLAEETHHADQIS